MKRLSQHIIIGFLLLFNYQLKRIPQHMRDINFIHICVLLINTTHPADWVFPRFTERAGGMLQGCGETADRRRWIAGEWIYYIVMRRTIVSSNFSIFISFVNPLCRQHALPMFLLVILESNTKCRKKRSAPDSLGLRVIYNLIGKLRSIAFSKYW